MVSFKITDSKNCGQPQLQILKYHTDDPEVILLNGSTDRSNSVCEGTENASVVRCMPAALQVGISSCTSCSEVSEGAFVVPGK